MQYSYSIKIQNEAGEPIKGARITLLDSSMNPISSNGNAVSWVVSGSTADPSSEQSSLSIKLSASGYKDKILTVQYGSSTVVMEKDSALTGTGKASALKSLIIFLIVLALIYAAYRAFNKPTKQPA